MLKLNFEKSIFIPTGWPGLDAELNGGLLSKTVTAVPVSYTHLRAHET